MTRRLSAAALAIATLIAVACSGAPQPYREQVETKTTLGALEAAPGADVKLRQHRANAGAPARDKAELAAEPMIVRRADLTLQVSDVAAAARQLEARAKSYSGYLGSSSLHHAADPPSGRLELRIPSKSLDAFLSGVGQIGTLLGESISAEDVGMEYHDLQAQLRNWTAEERRLSELFARSARVPDLLEVERELARVRGQIEQATGRRDFLARQVAFATVQVALSAAATPRTPPGWNAVAVAKEAGAALWEVALGLLTLAIWVGVFLPIWLPTYLLVRLLWGRRRRKVT